MAPSSSQVQWHPPPTGVYKINFDEAVFKDIGKAGVGVVVRNSDVQALASLSEQKLLQFSRVLEIEGKSSNTG
uniref:RNase H type-1 domain-containing protein n=1 Tax=Quercus lobata TaxID=97700 RepID=A0A7N2LFG7_QUELO